MLELWDFLDARFFSHLDTQFLRVVYKMKLSLKRCYVIQVYAPVAPPSPVYNRQHPQPPLTRVPATDLLFYFIY